MVERILDESMLIEGFDPEKLKALEKKKEGHEGWKVVYGAYQNSKFLQARVEGIEKIGDINCAIVDVDGVKGIIPKEYFGVKNKKQFQRNIGKVVAFKVLNYNRDENIFTGSRIAAKEHMAEIALRNINVGDTIPAVVRDIRGYGMYVDIGGIETEIPIDQVRYGWIDNLEDEYHIGDHLYVKVLDIKDPAIEADGDEKTDDEAVREVKAIDKKVVVSAKATMENPWENLNERLKVKNEYAGKVSGVAEFGIFVNLGDGIDSVARHLKFENVQKDDQVVVRIESIDVEKEQIRSRILRIV